MDDCRVNWNKIENLFFIKEVYFIKEVFFIKEVIEHKGHLFTFW